MTPIAAENVMPVAWICDGCFDTVELLPTQQER